MPGEAVIGWRGGWARYEPRLHHKVLRVTSQVASSPPITRDCGPAAKGWNNTWNLWYRLVALVSHQWQVVLSTIARLGGNELATVRTTAPAPPGSSGALPRVIHDGTGCRDDDRCAGGRKVNFLVQIQVWAAWWEQRPGAGGRRQPWLEDKKTADLSFAAKYRIPSIGCVC